MSLFSLFQSTRRSSEAMCLPLLTEDYIPQPIEYVSPPRWNLAHTSWFFEQFILKPFKQGYQEKHPLYNHLFNSYYEGAGERTLRHARGDLSRPSVKEVMAYRKHVDLHMETLLSGEYTEEVSELVILGINHEQQHQELFYTDLKYTFHLNPLFPRYGDQAFCEEGKTGPDQWIEVPEGIYEIGHSGPDFSFDNEGPVHSIFLHPFSISEYIISNGEYLDFIEDGGYRNHSYWHEEGWRWVNKNLIEQPMYWHRENKRWLQYTLAGQRPVDPAHPLTHINYYEAAAFASWKGFRLPTEMEWEVSCDRFAWGDRWEWTESAYLPYPGFKKADGTVGEYNGKFMVNQKVLRGGSVVTPRGHGRKSYRNFFHPHLGWQYTGIRLAK